MICQSQNEDLSLTRECRNYISSNLKYIKHKNAVARNPFENPTAFSMISLPLADIEIIKVWGFNWKFMIMNFLKREFFKKSLIKFKVSLPANNYNVSADIS
jgi:hypothetical protein